MGGFLSSTCIYIYERNYDINIGKISSSNKDTKDNILNEILWAQKVIRYSHCNAC